MNRRTGIVLGSQTSGQQAISAAANAADGDDNMTMMVVSKMMDSSVTDGGTGGLSADYSKKPASRASYPRWTTVSH